VTGPFVLGIDQGTSSTKCLLVDGSGAVVARGQAALSERHPQPGWVEQDADEIWRSVQAAVGGCLTPETGRAVVAVGLSTQRESCLLWDARTGAPLSPVLSWQDQRTSGLARRIGAGEASGRVRAISGLPLDPMFSALKARWLLDRVDPTGTRAAAGEVRIGTVDSWLMSRFGSEHVVEAGNASRTQLLDIGACRWSAELLDLFGIPAASLPAVLPSTGPFPPVRGLSPLPDGVPVLAVMADSHAALFGHGAHKPGQVKATHGTGSSVMGLVEAGAQLDPGLCRTIAWQTGEVVYAAEGNIRAAGSTLRWLATVLGVGLDELAGLARSSADEGLCLVPGFTGLGAPWWDDGAVGLIANLSLGTSRGGLARAAFDSIAHQIADVVDAIERGPTRIDALFVDGGPTRNDGLMQSEADLLGRPILRSDTAELSALGVVHLAGLRAGLWTEDDLATRRAPHDRFGPALDAGARQRARDRWSEAVGRARSRRMQADH
jgi:glycerol kinase